jgi:creatinine amidohydrolase/Fe(II)-dependent formamide hydrolase-like protein
VFIANGHGALNHLEVIRRLCAELSSTTPAKVDYHLTLAGDVLAKGWAGHADVVETSLMMHYGPESVDLGTLPPRDVPMRYAEFSICDGPAFTPNYDPEHIVRHDCRDATAEQGLSWFQQCVEETVAEIQRLLSPSPSGRGPG